MAKSLSASLAAMLFGGFLFASTVVATGSYPTAFAIWAAIAAASGGLFLVAARAPYLAGTSH